MPQNQTRHKIHQLIQRYQAMTEAQRKEITEAGVIHQFLDPLFDALVAHLYRLSRDDFAHLLATFPLVFPNDDTGQAKKEALLTVYDHFAQETKDWQRQ